METVNVFNKKLIIHFLRALNVTRIGPYDCMTRWAPFGVLPPAAPTREGTAVYERRNWCPVGLRGHGEAAGGATVHGAGEVRPGSRGWRSGRGEWAGFGPRPSLSD